MASVISHAVAAFGIAVGFHKPGLPKRFWLFGAVCSMLPDIDVIGFHFGVPYGDFWGHRGFTHSVIFAALIAASVVLIAFRSTAPGDRMLLGLCFFVATASHGLLDAMTNGGLGVAFFSPFDTTRYFLPWRPIPVSPIGVMRFFSPRGLEMLRSEFLCIWLPAALLASLALLLHRIHTPQPSK